MKINEYKVELIRLEPAAERTAAYRKVCGFLLKRYFEGREEYEGFGIFESINGRTGGERLFTAGSEDGGVE